MKVCKKQLIALLSGIFLCVSVKAQATIAVEKCMICHGKPELKRVDAAGKVHYLFVNLKVLKASVHAKKVCTDCHADVTVIPHTQKPKRVNCQRCHYKGNPQGAPQIDKYMEYEKSVHAQEVRKGNPKAPVCQDCHGNHDVRKTKDPLSHVFKNNVPETCGRCHMEEYAQYRHSIHGTALLDKGIMDAPSCTDCHGEHLILRHTNPQSPTYATRIVKTCAHCHEAVNIVGKYGINVEQVETYERSFHGIAVKFGEKTVANCASCHGVHNILPPEDPHSTVYIKNIPKTCGKPNCHPGANINFARGKIHVNPEKKSAGIIYWIALFFKILTASVLLGLIIHIAMDLYRRTQEYQQKKKEFKEMEE